MMYLLLYTSLALFGGYAGWHFPLTYLVAFGASIPLLIRAVLDFRMKPLTVPLLSLLVLALISSFKSGDLVRIYIWLIYLCAYQALPWNDEAQTAAYYLLPLYALFVLFQWGYGWWWDNRNVTAMNLWAIYFLAGDKGTRYLPVTGLAMLACDSVGGLLALLCGVIWPLAQQEWLKVAGLALGGVLAVPFINWQNAGIRLEMAIAALSDFISQPLSGIGFGNFFFQQGEFSTRTAHNLFLTIGAEMGLLGLAFLLSIVAVIWFVGPWPPFVVAWAVHSLVDSPHLFWLPTIGLMSVLGSKEL